MAHSNPEIPTLPGRKRQCLEEEAGRKEGMEEEEEAEGSPGRNWLGGSTT